MPVTFLIPVSAGGIGISGEAAEGPGSASRAVLAVSASPLLLSFPVPGMSDH